MSYVIASWDSICRCHTNGSHHSYSRTTKVCLPLLWFLYNEFPPHSRNAPWVCSFAFWPA